MERKVKKMMADLQFIINHGQISVDFIDQGYKRMLFSALEATGKGLMCIPMNIMKQPCS